MDALVPTAITGFTWTGDPAAAQAAADRLARTVFHLGDGRILVVRPHGRPVLSGPLAHDGTFRLTAADVEATGVVTSFAGTTAVTMTWSENAATYRATAGLRTARPDGTVRAVPRG